MSLEKTNEVPLFHQEGILSGARRGPHCHGDCALVFLSRDRKCVVDDRIEYKTIRARGEAIAGTEFNVDVFHFEIGDPVQFLVLLLLACFTPEGTRRRLTTCQCLNLLPLRKH